MTTQTLTIRPDLDELMFRRRQAEARIERLAQDMRAADADCYLTPIWSIRHGRAVAKLQQIQSNFSGAVETAKNIDSQIWEALNPELA